MRFLIVALVACRAAEAPQVALLLSSLHGERYARDVRYFEHRAHELGLPTLTLAAGDDPATQAAQVDDVLARGVRVLVVQPADSEAAASYVRAAHEHGAKLIAYDRAIESPDVDAFVAHDSYRIGVLEAEAALAAGAHRFVLLAGPAQQSVAAEITRGYENTLAPYVARGAAEVVAKHHGPWSADDAQRTVEEALAHGEVDAILANNSSLARGAVAAVGGRHVFIAGADADAANVNYLCQGKQALEVLVDIRSLATRAADVAKRLLDGQPAPPDELAHVTAVTADTVKPLLVDSGYLTADQLPACKTQLAEAR